jgi:hypothetical protein
MVSTTKKFSDVRFPEEARYGIFLLVTVSRKGRSPPSFLTKWIKEALFRGKISRGENLTIFPQLVTNLRMCGAIHSLHHVFIAWCLIIYRENFTFSYTSLLFAELK